MKQGGTMQPGQAPLWPTTSNDYFINRGYLPASYGHVCGSSCDRPCSAAWDPQRWPEGLRSRQTYEKWNNLLRLVQERFPDHRLCDFTEGDLVDFLLQGTDAKTGRKWAPNTVRT